MYQQIKALFISLLLFNTVFSLAVHANPKTPDQKMSIENAILVEINAYRQQHHLSPLTLDKRISKQAATHSSNMAQHKISFGHSHFLKRVSALHKEIKDSGAAAENVAFNYKDAKDVVKNWLLSPGHKRNIVGNYNLTGIGIARNAQGKLYFTQIFMKTGKTQYVAHATNLPSFSLGKIMKRSAS